jgi:Tfp pilus assembly protein PilF
MAQQAAPLTRADAQLLNHAFARLQRGEIEHAAAAAASVVERAPAAADARHLLALCHKAAGRPDAALAEFEAAVALAPLDARLLVNFANLLSDSGLYPRAIARYREALALAPEHIDGWMNYGLTLMAAGNPAEACSALRRATGLAPNVSSVWQALGAAERAAERLEEAEKALRRAVALDARNGAAWINLGVVRRLLGDPNESLACYESARRAGYSGPELTDAEASAHLDLGDVAQAYARTRTLTQQSPAYAPGHAMLARLLWEHGARLAPGEDPQRSFRQVLAREPRNAPLRLELARFLLQSGAAAEALEEVRVLRSMFESPSLISMEAQALEALGETASATTLLRDTSAAARGDVGFLLTYVRRMLASGCADEAAAHALDVLALDPSSQLALAYLGVAWRLMDDPREHWLCDYERFIQDAALSAPAGLESEDFLRQLDATLTRLHAASREPVEQSLRGGSQTSGVLFGRRDPVIAALRAAVEGAMRAYIERLPQDSSHPFLRRRTTQVRFAGSWSVRLRRSGRHANHYHQEGWISSAFYVSLPPSVRESAADSRAGWIQFGQPPDELGLALAPRRCIKPEEGRLILFPSYVWHGTVPFEDDMPRLTVAFDAVPAG